MSEGGGGGAADVASPAPLTVVEGAETAGKAVAVGAEGGGEGTGMETAAAAGAEADEEDEDFEEEGEMGKAAGGERAAAAGELENSTKKIAEWRKKDNKDEQRNEDNVYFSLPSQTSLLRCQRIPFPVSSFLLFLTHTLQSLLCPFPSVTTQRDSP